MVTLFNTKHFALLDRRHWLNVFIIVALSVISFYTSFDGLSNYVSTGESGLSRGEMAFLAIIVVVIQLLLIVALNNLSRGISWSGKLMWVVLYMIAMSVSVFFSYSFYYKLMQADNFAQLNFDAQLSNALLKANIYHDSFIDIQHSSKSLTIYSKETAQRERRQGRTCGDDSPAGKGPRRDLREEEAGLFAHMSEDIALLSSKVDQDLTTLKAIKQSYSPENNTVDVVQQRMNEVISRINRYRQSSIVNQAIVDLQQHTGKARLRLWVQARQHTISCPDNKISRATKTLLSSLKELPVLNEITLFDSHNDKEVMARAMQVFLSIPTLLREALLPYVYADSKIASNAENSLLVKNETAISSADYAPFLLGGMVDVIIFLVGFTNGVQSKQRDYLRPDFYGEEFTVKDIVKMEKAFGLKGLRYILRKHLYSEKQGYVFIIPSEVYPELSYSSALIDLFESLLTSNRIVEPKARSVPFHVLPNNFQHRFKDDVIDPEHAPYFDYYPVTKRQWSDLSQSLNAFDMLGE
ncbi:MAG TPA: hypothetical protein EYG68_10325 [Leucothrix mucor]|nr:hypothetical protein [Leucothrix mucor]